MHPKYSDTTPQTRTLLEKRRETHGDAWKLTGETLTWLEREKAVSLHALPGTIRWAWEMILNKLLRALFSPKHIDHWRDIAGYAQLVVDYLEHDHPPASVDPRDPVGSGT